MDMRTPTKASLLSIFFWVRNMPTFLFSRKLQAAEREPLPRGKYTLAVSPGPILPCLVPNQTMMKYENEPTKQNEKVESKVYIFLLSDNELFPVFLHSSRSV